jgi:hypothetical protein
MWMNWTKTSERIPDRVPNTRYSQVWCLCVNDGEVKVLVFNHEHMCWDDHSGDDYYCDIGEVSHWMLLPPPPTAEEMGSAGLHLTTGQGYKVHSVEWALSHMESFVSRHDQVALDYDALSIIRANVSSARMLLID